MRHAHVAVVGAGVAGLVAAAELAARGAMVTVVERAATPGGKMRQVAIGDARLDAGPTVFTMRWVFEELFAAVGSALEDHLTLRPAEILARHAWNERERLDLYADIGRSADAIAAHCAPPAARRYLAFCGSARRVYETLERPFIRAPRPSPLGLVRGAGLGRLRQLWQLRPFATLWRALGDHFHDPRLRQLFGRYATYCGSSPFQAPATLMLVAHVEQQGVWLVEGGMQRLAQGLAALAEGCGARLRFGAEAIEVLSRNGRVSGLRLAGGEHLTVDAVVVNADPAALATGLLGPAAASAVATLTPAARSLSAVTWCLLAEAAGFPLLRHNVFFSTDYAREFDDIFRHGRLPGDPTVYVCAQDRDSVDGPPTPGRERLFCLVNAPASGDTGAPDAAAVAACGRHAFARLARCGLQLKRRPEHTVVTTPATFQRLFPASGGALYGSACHGWSASFRRPASRTRLRGLYLAGGSTHPGPGVPMAALSGRLAAASVLMDT